MKVIIFCYLGDDFVGSCGRDLGAAKLGRLELAGGVCLPYEGVSRLHAILELDEASGQVMVTDLGSPHGTFVNGERVNGRRAVSSGDRVRLGTRVVLVLVFPVDGHVVDAEYLPPRGLN